VHFAHVYYFVEGLAATAVVARMLADSTGGCGQWIVENDGFKCVFEAAFLEKFEEARDVHAQRATVFAGREGEFLTDAGAATVSDDVIFVFFAEVTDGGEDWIRRGLAEAAERTFTDHAA
jgi:hypothetical protein